MTLIFPMAGLSSRFTKEGYSKPKYMLPVDEQSVFYHAVNGFCKYFNDWNVLFIYRDIQDTKSFIDNECKQMALEKFQCVELKEPTDGQAQTVAYGLEQANIDKDEDILIFNIDTFRPNYTLPQELDFTTLDGYLEVFEHEGEQWSFVLPLNELSNQVVQTAEKNRISSLCSSGLYYFKYAKDYLRIYETMFDKNERSKNEFYIAPMYNYLIDEKKDIRYSKILLDEIIFCGTPKEYELLR